MAAPQTTYLFTALLLAMFLPSGAWADDNNPYHIDVPKMKAVAEKGNPMAEAFMGDIYSNGWGTPKNIPEAMKWYRKGADDGNAPAQLIMGKAYEKGTSVPQDFAQAAQWFRKAADQNNTNAQVLLGMAYDSGKGVEKDNYEALKWYHKAADKNNYPAQLRLCTAYYGGNGIVKDYVKAYVWCELATANTPSGKPLLNLSLSTLHADIESHLDASQLALAKRLVDTWRPYQGHAFSKEY